MPIPVTFPTSPVTITDLQNTQAETFLALLCQLIDQGTAGSTITTPPLTAADPNSPGSNLPVDLLTAQQQLFYRHLGIALAVAGIGGGGSSFTRVAQSNVTKGQAVYYSSNDEVSPGDSSNIDKCGIIGVATATTLAGNPVPLISLGVAAGVLSGAVAGTPYYMGHGGQPIQDASLVSGDRILRLGYAKNTTDLEVTIQDIGQEPS